MIENKDNRHWEVLESKYLIQEPWCTVRKDRVKLPTGVIMPDYYVLEYPNWVNILGVTKENKFVFVKQYRHGLRINTYELPAGVCEDTDSSPMESAQREMLEETGYGGGKWELLTVISPNPGTHTNLCYCFLATDLSKIAEQHLEQTEDLEVELLTLDEVKDILNQDLVKQAMHATPLWKYLALYAK